MRIGIQVIARAAAVLRALKDTPTGMSRAQKAGRVDLPRSTVQRTVGGLQKKRLGPEVTALAEATRYNVVESCRRFLSGRAQDTGETADLWVLRGAGMIFPDQVPGSHRLRAVSSAGAVFPLTTTATANGRAVLTALPPAQAACLIGDDRDRRPLPGAPQVLLDSLDQIRRTGLAHDLDEHTSGISAMGSAFADRIGNLHAISLPIPSSRFAARRAAVETALHQARTRIDKMMVQPDRSSAVFRPRRRPRPPRAPVARKSARPNASRREIAEPFARHARS